MLFLQEIIDSMKPGGRAGIVVDEGLLFRTNETAFVQTKRKLLDECDLYCIVSLPGGVFTQAGAGAASGLPLWRPALALNKHSKNWSSHCVDWPHQAGRPQELRFR